jgi:hypothetical protein
MTITGFDHDQISIFKLHQFNYTSFSWKDLLSAETPLSEDLRASASAGGEELASQFDYKFNS